jgi:hypothetical protein
MYLGKSQSKQTDEKRKGKINNSGHKCLTGCKMHIFSSIPGNTLYLFVDNHHAQARSYDRCNSVPTTESCGDTTIIIISFNSSTNSSTNIQGSVEKSNSKRETKESSKTAQGSAIITAATPPTTITSTQRIEKCRMACTNSHGLGGSHYLRIIA